MEPASSMDKPWLRPVALALPLALAGCLLLGQREQQLGDGGSRFRVLVEADRLEIPDTATVLALASEASRLPVAWTRAEFVDTLQAFVARGGSLLLLGGAAGMAAELGLTAAPAIDAELCGRDGAEALRHFGLDLDGRAPAALGVARERWTWIGTHGRVLSARFDPERLGGGEVWGRQLQAVGRSEPVAGAPALVAWRHGKGRVVALGLAPWDRDGELLEALVRELDGGRQGGLWMLPVVAADPWLDHWSAAGVAPAPAPFGRDLVRPRVLHQGLILGEAGRDAEDPGPIIARALADGADLFVVTDEPGQGAEAEHMLRRRARALHERGALLALDPGSNGVVAPGRLAALLAAPTDDGDPVDGLGLAGDLGAWLVALGSLQPGAFGFGSEPVPSTRTTGVVRPGAGRVGVLPVRGLVAPELDAVHPPALFGMLDLEAAQGLGARPDWLAAQVLAFVRSRERAAVVVRGIAGAGDPDFVADLIERPLASALSFRLEATGRGGLRESLARSLTDAPPLLRALSDAPAGRMVVQNRFLRLEGSQGALCWDPDGSGGFDRAHRVALAPRFASVRLHGLRPLPASVLRPELVLELRVEAPDRATILVPADEDWLCGSIRHPVRKRLRLSQGSWRLDLAGRAYADGAVLAVRADGVLLGCLAARGGEEDRQELLLGLASDRIVELELEPVLGEGFELNLVACRRLDDAGLEAIGAASAGPRAELDEVAGSSYCRERRRSVLLGDLPALVHEVCYERVLPGVGVERQFGFAGYVPVVERRLRGHGRAALRLADPSGRRPELWVLLAGLAKQDRLRFTGEDGLVLDSHPRGRATLRVGVVLAAAVGSADPEDLLVACEDCLTQPRLAVDQGLAALGRRFDFPWRRVVIVPEAQARGLRLVQDGFEHAVHPRPAGDGGRGVLVPDGAGLRVAPTALPGPGPGCRRLLAMIPSSEACAVRIEARSAFVPVPSLRIGAAAVTIDDRSWAARDRDLVLLPAGGGPFRVALRPEASGGPSLAATTAGIRSCDWDAQRGELRLLLESPVAGPDPDIASFGLRLAGRRPQSVEGAVLLPPDANGAVRMLAPGGEILLRYGPSARPGR